MATRLFLDLAAAGHAVPIGTDLVLHEAPDPEVALNDAARLADVIARAARRYRTPLALPVMDLRIEKQALLTALGVPAAEHDAYHFTSPPTSEQVAQVERWLEGRLTPRMTATCGALRTLAGDPALVPVGMGIGPFSLMTKLLADPITPVYLAGTGATAAEEPDVGLLTAALELGLRVILRYAAAQVDAGAKAIVICEPAANTTYLSPNQLSGPGDIFERFVLEPNRRLKALLDARGVDLVLHDCGELTADLVTRLAGLQPAMLSLGSSRRLWEDAARVSPHIVLYGNLPSKQFYSDALLPRTRVVELARELRARMADTAHPFILGSECDVLSVTGCEAVIREKVAAMMEEHPA